MTTATKEHAELVNRRDALLEERGRLLRQAEKRREHNEMLWELIPQIRKVDEEIASLTPAVKQSRREAGYQAAAHRMADPAYVKQIVAVAATLEPWAALSITTTKARAEGEELRPLPPAKEEELRQAILWLQYLVRLGLDSASLPPALRALVGEGG
jgi:hypothetical protein